MGLRFRSRPTRWQALRQWKTYSQHPMGFRTRQVGRQRPRDMSVVRLSDSLRFARSRKAPRSHRASATCAPRLAAPDRSGVQPFRAFGPFVVLLSPLQAANCNWARRLRLQRTRPLS